MADGLEALGTGTLAVLLEFPHFCKKLLGLLRSLSKWLGFARHLVLLRAAFGCMMGRNRGLPQDREKSISRTHAQEIVVWQDGLFRQKY